MFGKPTQSNLKLKFKNKLCMFTNNNIETHKLIQQFI